MKTPRRLHIRHRPAEGASARPPLLFVHGGYIHSGCWDIHFLPHFQNLGYDCHALDLSGHGASEGRDELQSFGLDDYVQDVAQAVAGLARAPVLVGHSMGAIVVQRYLEKGAAAGVALLSPVPPTGMTTSSAQLAARQPQFVREAARAVRRRYSEDTLRVMRDVYFTPQVGEDHLTPFLDLVQPESMQAVAELMALALHFPKRRPRIPALVMGGDHDAVFPASMLHFTATSWNGETRIVRGAGHMLMLDPTWPEAAATLAAWLERLPGD